MLAAAARSAIRLSQFGIICAAFAAGYLVRSRFGLRPVSMMERAQRLQWCAQRVLKCWRIDVTYWGIPPTQGLIVSNHLSYLDILVLAARQPLVFVAKSEVRRWPVLGWLAQCAGTQFVRRQAKTDVLRMVDQMHALMQQGLVVVLFPEGTSSDGSTVLPFRSPLLEAAARASLPACPIWLAYTVPGGNAALDVCFWGDMWLVPHLARLTSKKTIQATVRYGIPTTPLSDRKKWAVILHQEVVGLARG
jgi:lyso-ornithine lipid O-acyltransferase